MAVSPTSVSDSQNLSPSKIPLQQSLHPPQEVESRMDETSGGVAQNIEPSKAGMSSEIEERSIGERSFNVFHDDDRDGAMDVSKRNILPEELTGPTLVGH